MAFCLWHLFDGVDFACCHFALGNVIAGCFRFFCEKLMEAILSRGTLIVASGSPLGSFFFFGGGLFAGVTLVACIFFCPRRIVLFDGDMLIVAMLRVIFGYGVSRSQKG